MRPPATRHPLVIHMQAQARKKRCACRPHFNRFFFILIFGIVLPFLVFAESARTVFVYSGLIFIACLSLLLFVLSCWLDRYKNLKPFCGLEQYFNGSSIVSKLGLVAAAFPSPFCCNNISVVTNCTFAPLYFQSYDETKFDDDHANDSAIVLDRIAFGILSLVFSAFLCFA